MGARSEPAAAAAARAGEQPDGAGGDAEARNTRAHHAATRALIGCRPRGTAPAGAAGGASLLPLTSLVEGLLVHQQPVLPSQLEPFGQGVLDQRPTAPSPRRAPSWPPVTGTGIGARRRAPGRRPAASRCPCRAPSIRSPIFARCLGFSRFASRRLRFLLQSRESSSMTRVGLQVQRAVAPAEQVGLIDHGHLGADGDQVEEHGDVLGVQPHAAVARAHADAVGLVGAVDQIARPAQAKRVLRPADCRVPRARLRGQHVAVLGVLLAHRLAAPPRPGSFCRLTILVVPSGSLPAHPADADRDACRRSAARPSCAADSKKCASPPRSPPPPHAERPAV